MGASRSRTATTDRPGLPLARRSSGRCSRNRWSDDSRSWCPDMDLSMRADSPSTRDGVWYEVHRKRSGGPMFARMGDVDHSVLRESSSMEPGWRRIARFPWRTRRNDRRCTARRHLPRGVTQSEMRWRWSLWEHPSLHGGIEDGFAPPVPFVDALDPSEQAVLVTMTADRSRRAGQSGRCAVRGCLRYGGRRAGTLRGVGRRGVIRRDSIRAARSAERRIDLS